MASCFGLHCRTPGETSRFNRIAFLSALSIFLASMSLFADLPNIVYTSGAYIYTKNLIKVPGSALGFDFNVEFKSRRADSLLLKKTRWRLGTKWLHSYQWQLVFDSTRIAVYRPDGGVELFWTPKTPDSSYAKDSWVKNKLLDTNSSGDSARYIYRTKERSSFYFDRGGRLIRMVDPTGINKIILSYAPAPTYNDTLLQTITDTRGNSAVFYYDRTVLISVVYRVKGKADSLAAHFDYARNGTLRKITDINGDSTLFEIDRDYNIVYVINNDGDTLVKNSYQNDRLKKQIDAKGDSTKYDYVSRKDGSYSSDSMLTVTNRCGVKQVIIYTILQQVSSLIDSGSGMTEKHWYNDAGNDTMDYVWGPAKMDGSDLDGYVNIMRYDARGNITTRFHYQCICPHSKDLAISTYGYDSLDHVILTVGPGGDSVKNVYGDPSNPNLLTQTTDPYNRTTKYRYNPKGLLSWQIDPDEGIAKNDWSDEGNLNYSVDADNDTIRYFYDAFGRRTTVIGPRKDTTRTIYDAKGRAVMEIDALGDTTRNEYDCEDRIISTAMPSGAKSRFRYTPTGREEAIINPLGDSLKTSYDDEDRPLVVRDELGRSTKYTYDKAGRIVAVRDQANRSCIFAYDIAGNLTSATDARGNTTNYVYDAFSRPIKTIDPLGNITTANYDNRDHPDSTVNARGQVTQLTYDKTGRVLKKRLPGRTISIVYDFYGKDSLIIDSSSTGIDTIVKRFDRFGRLVSRKDRYGKTVGYHYDAANNLDTLTYSDGKKVVYSHDLLNRITEVKDWAGRTTRYTYGKDNKITRLDLADGSIVRLTRDVMGRITAYRDSAAAGIIYSAKVSLNQLGLRTSSTIVEPKKAILTSSTKNLSYDRANRLILADSSTYSYDADGNMSSGVLNGKMDTLAYDPTNQLISAGGDLYFYDAEEARIQTKISGKTMRYVYDLNASLPSVLEETDTNGAITARYVYGIGLICRESAAGKTAFYHFDVQGNTVALTDSNGSITDKYAYTPYGALAAGEGSTPNPFKFCGRSGVADDGNGLYYMRARYYASELMRFVQQERVRAGEIEKPQTLNRYAYVVGNPVEFIDPNGQWFGLDDLIATIGGAIIGVAVQLVSDVVQTVIDKNHHWSWQNYVGAAVGGAVTGEASLYAGPVIGSMLGAAAGNVSTQLLNMYAGGGQENFDWLSLGVSVGVAGVTAGIMSKIGGTGWSGLAKGGKPTSSLFNISKNWRSIGENFKASSIYSRSEWLQYSHEAAIVDILKAMTKQAVLQIPAAGGATGAIKGYGPRALRYLNEVWGGF